MDQPQALQAWRDLGAEHMLPIHYGTFADGADTRDSRAALLRAAMLESDLDRDRVHIVPIGGQLGLLPREVCAARQPLTIRTPNRG